MFGLSFWELALILVVALVVLGPKRLPDAARTLGRALRSLRRASSDIRNAIEEPLREVREPLREMRDDLYDAVNKFSDDVVQSARDVGAESRELAADAPADAPAGALEAGDDGAQAEERRVASTDPFGPATVGEADEHALASGPGMLAAGPEPELPADPAGDAHEVAKAAGGAPADKGEGA